MIGATENDAVIEKDGIGTISSRENPVTYHLGPWGLKMNWVLLILLAALSCTSCSTMSEQKAVDASRRMETEDNMADTGCSYFYYLWGKSAELSGPEYFDEAVEAYEKALVCDEGATPVMQSLAILLLQMDRRQQAVVRLEKLLALQPNDLQIVSLLANVYAASNQIDKAVETYRRFLERQPDNQQALLLLGTFYARHKRYGEAEAVLEKLLVLDNDSPDGHQYLARLFRELNLFDRSINHYKLALSQRWSTLLALEAADLMEAQGKYEDAAELYRRMLAEDEANEHARVQLADIYMRLDSVDEALAILEELKDYTVDVAQVDLTIGRILIEKKRFSDAEVHFRNMLELYPEFEAARSLLALVYYEEGRKKEAIDTLAAIGPESENYSEVVIMLARMLVEMEDFDGAEALLVEAIERGTEPLGRMYTLLASLYQKRGQIDEARKIFQQAVEQFADDHRVYFEYGMFLDKIGEPQEAMKIMERVLELNPDDPYALNYIGYSWADKGINLEKAQQYLLEAVRQLPQDGFIRDSLGWVYYRQGVFEKAVQELEKAHQLEEGDPTILEHLGDAYLKIGNRPAAIERYRKALELYEDEEKKEAVRHKLQALPVELRKDGQ